ncbi:MAG: type II toxin-antitoxin system VapC family toxin [Thermoguttaceae bacterium]|jgi:predicted nucleic acid-binding protein|nr:type II toxin-antitoxin system VapC family toxin [Thermoguttaceae bacterium]
MKVYLDSVMIIYYLDHVGNLQARAARRLAELKVAADTIVVSDLVRLECRVDPIRKRDNVRLARFDGFFAHPDVQTTSLTAVVCDRAAQIRAETGYKTIDALHLAAAVESGCHVFLTNDVRLSSFPDLDVEILA